MRRALVISTVVFAMALAGSWRTLAASHYVTASGAGATDGSDFNNAWAGGLGINWGLVSNGDTIYFAGGVYAGFNVSKSGVTLKRATAAANSGVPGWIAGYDSTVQINVGTGAGAVGIRMVPPTSDNITVDGVVTDGIKIVNPTPPEDYNNVGTPGRYGILSVGNSNLFQNILMAGPAVPSGSYGFSIGNNYLYGWKTNSTIRYCTFNGVSTGIISGDTDYMLVEHCEFYNLYGNLWNHDNVNYVFSGLHGVWRNNYAHDWGAEGLYFATSPGGYIDDWQIYGNVFQNSRLGSGRAISFDPATIRYGPNWLIEGNTFIECSLAIRADFTRFGGYPTTGGAILNNIVWGTSIAYGAFSHDYNFYSGSAAGEANGIGSGSNPFVDLTNFDQHIISTVGATYPRSKGTNLIAAASPDRDGVARATPPSIGAYEYNAGTPPPPAVPGSIQLDASSYTVAQGASVNVTINRVTGTDGAVSAAYSTSDGSATATVDYTAATGTASFGAGSSAPVVVAVTALASGATTNRTLTFSLSSPTGGASIGSPSSATITIEGVTPPISIPTFGLSWNAADMQINSPLTTGPYGIYQPAETTTTNNAGFAQAYSVITDPGDYQLLCSVAASSDANNSFFVRINGTNDVWDIISLTSTNSVPDSRYVNWRGSGSFDAPEFQPMRWTFSSPVTNLVVVYGREANTVLSNMTWVLMTTNTPPPPVPSQVYFTLPSQVVYDSQSAVYVEIQRLTTNDVCTVDLVTANGTAIAGLDYETFSQTLVFNAGTSLATVPITIIPRPGYQGSRSFIVSLVNPVNAELYEPSMTSIDILDWATPSGRLNVHELRSHRIKVR